MRSIIFLTIIFTTTLAQAQLTLDRQFIGSSGASSYSGSLKVYNSVGETIVQNGISGSFSVSQGFQQVDLNPEPTDIEDLLPKVNYQFFPNPIKDMVSVQFESENPIQVQLSLYDLNGRQVWTSPDQLTISGNMKTQYNLSHLARGVYTMKIQDEYGQVLESVKLSKL